MTGVTPGAFPMASRWTKPIRPQPMTPTFTISLVSASSTLIFKAEGDDGRIFCWKEKPNATSWNKALRVTSDTINFIFSKTKRLDLRRSEICSLVGGITTRRTKRQRLTTKRFLLPRGKPKTTSDATQKRGAVVKPNRNRKTVAYHILSPDITKDVLGAPWEHLSHPHRKRESTKWRSCGVHNCMAPYVI